MGVGRFFIIVNLLMVLFFSIKFFSIYTHIASPAELTESGMDYRLSPLKRCRLALENKYHDLFHLPAVATAISGDEERLASESGLNELNTGARTIRVIGIFITDDLKMAVFSLTTSDKKHRKKPEIRKVEAGDKLDEYQVKEITAGHVCIEDQNGNRKILNIFKRPAMQK